MLEFLHPCGIHWLSQLGTSGQRPRRSLNFMENLCGGPAETSSWCQWQITGFVGLALGGFWLLFLLAKWGLAPRDQRETPQPLALVLASVILVAGLFVLMSNQKPVPSGESPDDDQRRADPARLIDPNGGASLIDPNGGG